MLSIPYKLPFPPFISTSFQITLSLLSVMYSATSAPPPPPPPLPPPPSCSQGHLSNLILPTAEGGSICLLCLSNLLSNPNSPTVHVSYALSQLFQALSQPLFLRSFLTFHSHFLISPLVSVLSSFDDKPIAKQTIDLIVNICEASNNHSEHNNEDVYKEFVARVSDRLSSGSLAWSRRQLYMVHSTDSQVILLCVSVQQF